MRYFHFLAVVACVTIGAGSTLAREVVRLPAVQNQTVQNHFDNSAITPQAILDTKSNVSDTSDKPYPILRGQGCYEEGCCPGGRWFVAMDYFYWQATQDATPYAGTLSRPSGTINGLPTDSDSSLTTELEHASYDRRSGLRANFGYQMSNLWDVGFRYTYFRTIGSTSLGDSTVHNQSVLANRLDRSMADDILNNNFDDGVVDYASQNLILNLNIYDLELRRQLCFDSQRLASRIVGGLRFAEIGQSSQIRYTSFDEGGLLTADTAETMNMNGTGFFVGGEAHYLVGWNMSLFARGAASLIYTNFNVSRRDLQTSTTEAGVRSISENLKSVTPVAELSLGLRWQRGRFHTAIGYDLATWFDMVQGIDVCCQDDVDGSTNSYRIERGNLSFDGFFLEAGMMF